MPRLLPLVLLLALAACSKSNPAPASGSATTSPPAAATNAPAGAAAPATPPPVKPVPQQLPEVVARVNGEPISKTEFDKAVGIIEARAGAPIPPDQRDRIYRTVLDQLIGFKLLAQESKSRKVAVPETEVDARMSAIRGQFPSQDVYEQALQQQKVSADQLKADTRQEIAINKLLTDELASKVTVTPESVATFYKENPQHFQQAERVRASHILVAAPKDADAPTKAKARAKAERLLKDVKGGKDFATLAKANSDDKASAVQGGDLGMFDKGQMVGPFNDVAFSLQPGAVSDIVETEFGFHIIKVAEKQPSRVVPLEEAKPQIQMYLEQENRKKVTETYVAALKAKGKIEVFI